MNAEENRRIIESFWKTMETNDFRAAGDFLHDRFVQEWPQSGELIRGRDNFVAINQQYPAHGPWRFAVNRLIADENGVATDVSVTDGVVNARVITFSEFQDDRIIRQIEYWPDPFHAPEWRAQWVERLGD